MLEATPVARPVIYTLAGCRAGERCVIERTEEDFTTRTDDHGARQRLAGKHTALGRAASARARC
jgi:hypothetical protein